MAQRDSTRDSTRKSSRNSIRKSVSGHAPSSQATHSQRGTLADETAPRKASEYWLAILGTIAVLFIAEWTFSDGFGFRTRAVTTADIKQPVALPDSLLVTSDGLLDTLAIELDKQWSAGDTENSTEDLLLLASNAVANEDTYQFAEAMRLLGVNALREADSDTAAVYLDEALSAFEELEDEIGIASVELLRGELNLKRRVLARRAAYAYDTMQLARWKTAHGYFHDAIDELQLVVNENLSLNRYGAAAAAYQTLYKGYTDHGQLHEAQEAGIEIVKLHASSGRPLQAKAMLSTLQANGLDENTVLQLTQNNMALQREYEESVTQLGRARDYRQLYNYFINAGDPVRAWQFRLKAQQSLRGVTQRAMHRQQTGVLALLYTSNDHMKRAQQSLNRASRLFSENDQSKLFGVSEELREQVF